MKPAIGWLGVALVAIAVVSLDETAVLFPWELFVPTVGCACAIAATYQQESSLARLLAARPLRWIGERSYGWYLLHYPAMVLASRWDPGARRCSRTLRPSTGSSRPASSRTTRCTVRCAEGKASRAS